MRVMLQSDFSTGYPVQHPEEKSCLFFPDHSLMTSETVGPIGSHSSHWAESHAILSLNWLEKIKSPFWNCVSDTTASQKNLSRCSFWQLMVFPLCVLGIGDNYRLIKRKVILVMSRTSHHSSPPVSFLLPHWNETIIFFLCQAHFSLRVRLCEQVLNICLMLVGKMLMQPEAHPLSVTWEHLL